jgi:ribosomal protein S18 acetylase RimI-like enzyme
MADWVIERLDRSHQRGAFRCGKVPLDDFIRTLASQYQKKRVGRTFVATEPGDRRVAGYYTSAAASFDFSHLPEAERRRLPGHPVPTIHMARLAVDLDYRGRRLGETLLFSFLRQAVKVSEDLGVFAVDVWAKDGEAKAFYLRYGFHPLGDDPFHLFLPMKTVETMFEA